jgi:hypothetical protein
MSPARRQAGGLLLYFAQTPTPILALALGVFERRAHYDGRRAQDEGVLCCAK